MTFLLLYGTSISDSFVISQFNQKFYQMYNCYNPLFTIINMHKQQGYAKRKAPLILPSISKRQQTINDILHNQKVLTKQVHLIDHIVKTDKLTHINHLFFTNEMKNRLVDDVVGCLQKEFRLLSYGFQFWSKGSLQFVRKKLIEIKPSFKDMLHDSSIRAIEQYQAAKIDLLNRKVPYKNSITPIRAQHNTRTSDKRRRFSRQTTIYNNAKQSNKKKSAILHTQQQQRRAFRLRTDNNPPAKPQQTSEINVEQIQKLLSKDKQNMISIWLPPQTYPQFFGIVIIKMIRTSKLTYCRLQKYLLFKQAVNRRLFESILIFVGMRYETKPSYLEMMMSKNDYNKYFEGSGWKMKSWQGVDKINAVFDPSQNQSNHV